MLQKAAPRLDVLWILPEQQRDLVFGLFDLLLKLWNALRRAIDEFFGLTQVEQRRNAAALPVLGKLQRGTAGLQSALENLQLGV